MSNVLCFDVGGSKLLSGILDNETGLVQCSRKVVYDRPLTIEYLIEQMKIAGCSFNRDFSYQCIGVSIPGPCSPEKGIIDLIPSAGIRDFNISDVLMHEFNVPVFIENDVNACAVAESVYGVCRNVENFLWVTLSNGCGGGLFLNGKLYAGKNNRAGEIGHVNVDFESKRICDCRKTGCFETYSSGRGIARTYAELKGIDTFNKLNGKYVALEAEKGDRDALQAFCIAGKMLARAVAQAVILLDLDKVVFGGGLIGSWNLIKKSFEMNFKELVPEMIYGKCSIELTDLGYDAGLKGACAITRR